VNRTNQVVGMYSDVDKHMKVRIKMPKRIIQFFALFAFQQVPSRKGIQVATRTDTHHDVLSFHFELL
jgi:hypothetical protein